MSKKPKLHKDVRLDWTGGAGDYRAQVADYTLDVGKMHTYVEQPRWLATLTKPQGGAYIAKVDFCKTRDQAMLAIEAAFAGHLKQYVDIYTRLTSVKENGDDDGR